jgi:hypothetical protein
MVGALPHESLLLDKHVAGVTRRTERLCRMLQDDRFDRNMKNIRDMNASDIDRIVQALQDDAEALRRLSYALHRQ